jgi:hypothetical protein
MKRNWAKKDIILSFDYELFLGKTSGCVDKCLIKPTEQLLKILKSNEARAIFFIDTAYIKRLKNEDNTVTNHDFFLIRKQLIEIAKEGHYLFHHIHPHWLDAVYQPEINEWNLSNINRYTFNKINSSELRELLEFSHSFLCDIYESAKIKLTPDGFRAGGLIIEPFPQIAELLHAYNINNDFSAIPESEIIIEDEIFKMDQVKKNPYKFSESPNSPKSNGVFTEYPVTRLSISGFSRIMNSFAHRISLIAIPKNDCNGTPAKLRENKIELVLRRNRHELTLPLSLESLNFCSINTYHSIIQNINYAHFLSHPKLMTQASIKYANKLLSMLRKEYKCEFDFKNFVLQ